MDSRSNNPVEQHNATHSTYAVGHCWRKDRKTGKMGCRYNFPKDLQSKDQLQFVPIEELTGDPAKDKGKSKALKMEFLPRRNDSKVKSIQPKFAAYGSSKY